MVDPINTATTGTSQASTPYVQPEPRTTTQSAAPATPTPEDHVTLSGHVTASQLHKQGQSLAQIAAALGVSTKEVQQQLNQTTTAAVAASEQSVLKAATRA